MNQNQEWLEYQYSKKHLHKVVLADLQGQTKTIKVITKATNALHEWAYSPSAYQSKTDRKLALIDKWERTDELWDFTPIVEHILVLLAQREEITLNDLAMSCLKFSDLDKRQAITLACEVLVVCAIADLFDLNKVGTFWMCSSIFKVSPDVRQHIDQTTYMPPMVCKPNPVRKNWDTPYFTYEGESLILGNRLNYHKGDICLDVINIQNAIPLRLSLPFMAVYSEKEPDHVAKASKDGKTLNKVQLKLAQRQWKRYEDQCQYFNHLLSNFGNCIYLGNKVDKRGRLYASGYHINPAGSSYKKAVLEFKTQEHINLPTDW